MGLPLVLIPGMMCDARLFGPQIEALSARRSLHLAAITEYDTVQALAQSILMTAPLRFALAGLSMGGIVAMEMVAQAPERIERLALLDTNPKAESDAIAAQRAPQMERVLQGGLGAVMRDEMKPNFLSDGPRRDAISALCMAMAIGLGSEVFVRQSLALRGRPDQQATLARVRVPSLVLCGEDDALCPLHRHELMHALIPGSQLEVIAGAGHLPTLEQPDATNAALVRWLEM